METITTTEVERLVNDPSNRCVSIYLPVIPLGAEAQQNPIRLKNLLQQAEDRLVAKGTRAPEAREMLKPGRDLLTDEAFWRQQSRGLAVFASPELFRCYRVPGTFEESVRVARRFRVRPLLPLLEGGRHYFILALSEKHVRLLRATRYAVEELQVEGLPPNLEEALAYDTPEESAQYHTALGGRVGKQAAVFHGQGGEPDAAKDELQQYFHLVDAALHEVLREEQAPLVLAAVEASVGLYRKVNTYDHLAERAIQGSPDLLSPAELHQCATRLMQPYFEQDEQAAAARLGSLAGGDKVSDEMQTVLSGAFQGKIDALFVEQNASLWGRFDAETNVLEAHPQEQQGDDDLLELAAVQTIVHRGDVYAVPAERMPLQGPVAALFRY